MTPALAESSIASRPIRVGVVSFLNTLPLIDGLDGLVNLHLKHSVPSLLLDQLLAGEVDVALCSSIDYQRSSQPLLIVPCGLLGCEGPTMTVRLYSSVPIAQLQEVHCDTDSHTSIALLRILLKDLHGISPRLIDYNAREHVARHRPVDWPAAMLLIGDKVVTDATPAVRYPHQMDLGAAWQGLTGAPFVFAAWMARADADRESIGVAAAALDRQRRHNEQRVDRIIHRHAQQRGWPRDLAREYLTHRLVYDVTPQRLEAMELFFRRAAAHGLVDHVRPIELLAF